MILLRTFADDDARQSSRLLEVPSSLLSSSRGWNSLTNHEEFFETEHFEEIFISICHQGKQRNVVYNAMRVCACRIVYVQDVEAIPFVIYDI